MCFPSTVMWLLVKFPLSTMLSGWFMHQCLLLTSQHWFPPSLHSLLRCSHLLLPSWGCCCAPLDLHVVVSHCQHLVIWFLVEVDQVTPPCWHAQVDTWAGSQELLWVCVVVERRCATVHHLVNSKAPSCVQQWICLAVIFGYYSFKPWSEKLDVKINEVGDWRSLHVETTPRHLEICNRSTTVT